MAQAALQQSRSFCWPAKARQLLNIYTQALRDAKDISS
jgi:hypothetical protein